MISMMYHHVGSDRCSNDLEIFEQHLAYISKNFTTLFPTLDELPKKPICLVFDDGYYDFYKFIYPLLKKYNLKALLAVTPKYILDDTDKDDALRLGFEHNDLFKEYKNATFCTYKELQEMSQSSFVQVVSHSYSHKNLLENDVDLEKELLKSKELIEQKLGTKVESFVYPFGKYNQKVLDETMKYYKYSFRIGNGVNKDFRGVNGVIYRIDGDFLRSPDEIFSLKNMLRFIFKTFIKNIVGNR
ncbi:polysaccharide deacetylase [Sulfurimonas autotrophica DSM 16294]|uniref:Polysaccharide deacetylase n=1 Tax=Sulfurimonas autotrophica (strain ATCC BAA-671 / DSM 16294 / JCM 11897 / OK10) TaxID=563040 RepID=E0UV27_SULAO|nr:polysaccharide deacetylase [Sulfurimonas autotrophica DSM 16294]